VGCGNNSTTTSTNDSAPTALPVNQAATPSATEIPISQNPTTEKPVAPESNPPGDIPDNQVFVTYNSVPGGYKLEVPEGWARQTEGKNVKFTDKFNGVQVIVTNEPNPITAATVKAKQAIELQKTGRALQVVSVKDVQLPSGKAVLIDYTSNSEPDAVTEKQIRLENSNYLFFKNGKLVTLRLWAPKGADNVDQWQRISRSFQWS
jgi:hypothetical protein